MSKYEIKLLTTPQGYGIMTAEYIPIEIRRKIMSKLVWDQIGERLYETGVRNVVLYPTDKTGAYGAGVAWNGVTSVNESPSGAESNPQYADDIKYLDLRSVEERDATIEAFTYPDEFAECDGSAEVVAGVTIGQQSRRTFGLCYRTILGNDTDTDDYGYKLHILYGAVASPSERSYNSVNDSPDPITFSWEVSTTPVSVTGYKSTSSIEIDSTKVDKTKLAALEDILYGTDKEEARLPMPDEIITMMKAS
jgi:hypothetical protein